MQRTFMRGSRGGGGMGSGPPPLKIHKNIGFLSNNGPDLLKITIVPSQHSMLGHHRQAKRHLNGGFDNGPLLVVFRSPPIN